jgi:hypothetical protein
MALPASELRKVFDAEEGSRAPWRHLEDVIARIEAIVDSALVGPECSRSTCAKGISLAVLDMDPVQLGIRHLSKDDVMIVHDEVTRRYQKAGYGFVSWELDTLKLFLTVP